MRLTLGISPCPNDTFIFDALVNNKIDTEGLSFDVVMEDVQTLNLWALESKLDITKISYGVLPLVLNNYIVLNSGSALGHGVGPILISNTKMEIGKVEDSCIAIPGEHTTAHLLFSLAFPNAKNKVFIRYDEIEKFVSAGKGPGVIIHENRFTYSARGLHKIIDLGEHWEKETGNPVPLGGIVVKRTVDKLISFEVDRLIKKSIEHAYRFHFKELTDYVKIHSQEMSEEVMRKHIDLYVNNYSIQLGNTGRAAVEELLNIHQKRDNHKPLQYKEIFLTQPLSK